MNLEDINENISIILNELKGLNIQAGKILYCNLVKFYNDKLKLGFDHKSNFQETIVVNSCDKNEILELFLFFGLIKELYISKKKNLTMVKYYNSNSSNCSLTLNYFKYSNGKEISVSIKNPSGLYRSDHRIVVHNINASWKELKYQFKDYEVLYCNVSNGLGIIEFSSKKTIIKVFKDKRNHVMVHGIKYKLYEDKINYFKTKTNVKEYKEILKSIN